MFRSIVFGLLGFVALACGATNQCHVASAQAVEGWPPKEIKSTGKTWGVYMKQAKFENLAEKGMLVAEADSEQDANRLADAYFKHPKNKFPHDLFEVHKRDSSKSDGSLRTLSFDMPNGQKLVVPLSNVDPKPVPTAKPPVVDLKGKVAKGKLGSWDVTFEFQEGNKLAIAGEAVGEGEWGLAGDQLTMTTESSVFLGVVDKDGNMKGKRVRRNGKDLMQWEANIIKPIALQGTTWVGTSYNETVYSDGETNLSKHQARLTFRGDGTAQFKWHPGAEVDFNYRKTATGVELFEKDNVYFVFVMAGDAMTCVETWSEPKPTDPNKRRSVYKLKLNAK